jgi:hypothetical protein
MGSVWKHLFVLFCNSLERVCIYLSWTHLDSNDIVYCVIMMSLTYWFFGFLTLKGNEKSKVNCALYAVCAFASFNICCCI